MKFEEIFRDTDFVDGLDAGSKRQVLTAVSSAFAEKRGTDAKSVFDVLHERERLGSTAIGGGIAIPHTKVPNLDQMVGLVVRLETPVDFDAPDDEPVDLVVTLLAPDTGSAEHLRVLARLARALRNPEQRARIRQSMNADEMLRALGDTGPHQEAA